MGFLDRRIKGQPAIEFLSVYAWALLSVILLVVVVTVLASSQSKNIYPPSHCYITPAFPCYNMYIMSNSVGTVALIIFNNNFGRPIDFPSNAFSISPTYANTIYTGQCIPANVAVGGVAYCNATLSGYSTSVGTVLSPNFVVSYRICEKACSNTLPIYNTSGSAEVTVSPYNALVTNFLQDGTVAGGGTYNYGTLMPISDRTIQDIYKLPTPKGVGFYY